MNSPRNENVALRRLLAIDWTFTGVDRRSHITLIVEYLRRAALWAKHLQVTDHWPFFDIAGYLVPEVRASQSAIEQLEATLTPYALWPTIKKTCICYLHWETAKNDHPEVVARCDLPEPFEPLIRLYERGGRFYTEHGFINVNMVGIPAKSRGWQAYAGATPFLTLDNSNLDRIDAVGSDS